MFKNELVCGYGQSPAIESGSLPNKLRYFDFGTYRCVYFDHA